MKVIFRTIIFFLFPVFAMAQHKTQYPVNAAYKKLSSSLITLVHQKLDHQNGDSSAYYFSIRVAMSEYGTVDSISLSKHAPASLREALGSRDVYKNVDWPAIIGRPITRAQFLIIPFSCYSLESKGPVFQGRLADELFIFTSGGKLAAALDCILLYPIAYTYYPAIP